MIKVNIIEDDIDIRTHLALIIDGTDGFECKNAWVRVEDALTDLENEPPDVLLMDISLPGMSGIRGVKIIKQKNPTIEVIMLTVHQEDELVFDSLCAGACGYLTKNIPPEKILDAIQEAHNGGAPMSTRVARMVVSSFQKQTESGLSKREHEVLTELCKGKSYKMVADKLFISQDTVRTHIRSIYKKLEVHSKSEAVAKAIREGLV